jgi:hypothetical protein
VQLRFHVDGGHASLGWDRLERGNSARRVPNQEPGDSDLPQVAAEHSVRPEGPGAHSAAAASVAHRARHSMLGQHADWPHRRDAQSAWLDALVESLGVLGARLGHAGRRNVLAARPVGRVEPLGG